jgi:hypothetical protein
MTGAEGFIGEVFRKRDGKRKAGGGVTRRCGQQAEKKFSAAND